MSSAVDDDEMKIFVFPPRYLSQAGLIKSNTTYTASALL